MSENLKKKFTKSYKSKLADLEKKYLKKFLGNPTKKSYASFALYYVSTKKSRL